MHSWQWAPWPTYESDACVFLCCCVPAVSQAGERLVRPAVQGTEAVLRAATRAGGIRRVVMTSSVAAVYGDAWDRGKGHVFTEEVGRTLSGPLILNCGYDLHVALVTPTSIALPETHGQQACTG